jgi:16S rRNA (uracil1498-N3)-methyltransferase
VHARFLVPGSYATGDQIDLPDTEAQHLTRVLRLRSGDAVQIFDGRGREFAATVAGTTKTTARVLVGAPVAPAPEPRVAITLAHAVLKGDKMDDVVRDAAMIGVAAIQPVVTTRSEVTLSTLERGNRRDRWERVALSSVKQCGRAIVPAVVAAVTFDGLLEALGRVTLPQPALLFAEPSAGEGGESLAELEVTAPREATILIGPEGGWTPDEIERAGAVCRLVRLGGRTLRADAMATVAVAALFARWGEY